MKKFIQVYPCLRLCSSTTCRFIRVVMVMSAKDKTFGVASVPPAQVALVPGAGFTADDRPTLALRDRIDGAIELYRAR
jgi:vancomycin permeability regulator SanA